MTHRELVEVSSCYLEKRLRYKIVFKELVSTTAEIPDVIAWRSGCSVLVECKVSRNDFFADKKKAHRINAKSGMGQFRYYSCPENVIKQEELPDKWGLLYADEFGKIRVIKQPEQFMEFNARAEREMMYSALRRLALRGYLPEIYDTLSARLGQGSHRCRCIKGGALVLWDRPAQ